MLFAFFLSYDFMWQLYQNIFQEISCVAVILSHEIRDIFTFLIYISEICTGTGFFLFIGDI